MNSTTNINNNQEYQINILRNGIKNIDITENKNKSIEDISHDIQNLHIVTSRKNQNENLDSYTVCSVLTEQVLRTYNLTLCNKKNNNSDKYSKIKKEKSKVKKKSSLEVFNMTQEQCIIQKKCEGELNKYNYGGKFKCAFCNDQYFKRCHLVKHINMKHSKDCTKYCCNLCNRFFFKENDLIKHIKQHIGNKYKCYICHKCFVKTKDIKLHKKIHKNKFHIYSNAML